jgi:hypothetical protein
MVVAVAKEAGSTTRPGVPAAVGDLRDAGEAALSVAIDAH